MVDVMSDSAINPTDESSDFLRSAGTAFGLSIAAIIMDTFGFAWLCWGYAMSPLIADSSSAGALPWAGWIVLYIVFLTPLSLAIVAMRRARRQVNMHMRTAGTDSRYFRESFGRQFRLISILEVVGIGIVIFLAVYFHRPDLLAAGISVVVGLHFLPLARLFRLPAYYVTGMAIFLCGLLSMIFLHGNDIAFAAGIGTGLVLWITAAYVLRRSRRLLRDLPTESGAVA
jgi:hypothetical protein